MYRRTLKVGVFGLDAAVAEGMRSVEAPARFEVSVVEGPWPAGADLDECDIALVPSPDAAQTPHRARLVLCASAEAVAELDAAAVSAFLDVWAGPFPPALAAFHFRKLLEREKEDADLALTRQYLDTAIDSMPELVWFKDARGAHLKVNDAFCETVGKTKEQVEGRGHYYIWDITPDEYAQGEYVCLESEEETMRSSTTLLFDEQVKTKRGMRQFKTYKSPLFDADGTVMGTVGVAHDVTDLGNVATELDILINAMPFAIVVEDTDGVILNVNHVTEQYFRVKRDNVIGGKIKHWRRVVFGDELADAREEKETCEFTANIAGTDTTFELNKAPIVDVFGNVTGQLRIYRDVTIERVLERRAAEAARTDYLTGLYNRRYFYERLEESPRDEPITIVTLDLDDFKDINDRYGHAAGDVALVQTARILRETFPDGLVVRWGGDEFVVALPSDRDPREVCAAVQDMIEQLHRKSLAASESYPFTASAGIATGLPCSIDELIKRSDEALYRAKRQGSSLCRIDGEED
ncbi:diguanylate cyclase domain-containing protein [Gordonibacter massiliensis (ex Traore et al. 2017)]|uniref:diguanylate cyclase domain-containing protein n=1 Tax=Gordonibacter massiliensis (ex Traore et al. 2017) TaxID=1841863 RepID=UPI001C8B18AE|nr:diguanylate cyclase [Gordonibacter massiliensis (ex Traore et al. 2017)]MBX9034531.1 diguanylate cyclase [Gordonibacter massiliensis (ex Traore et al. 2017)]